MKYIKHPIPEEITDKGGASVQLVQKQTIPLDGAIDAAIEAHYAIGQKEFIRNGVIGTMKSMAAGVRRDGRPRSIDGFLTVYPVFKGPIDLEKGYDPEVNKVQIKARLLNELELDISGWSFEDVTPGKKAFKLNSVKAGTVLNVIEVGEAIAMNGENLPSTEAGEELRVHWAVEGTDKSGDVPAEKISSDVGRADIAEDALAELASEEYDGKTIVFTVRGNFSSAKISATLRYVEPPLAPKLTRVSSTPGGTDGELSRAMSVYLAGSNLADPSAVAIDYKSVTGVESTRTLTEDEYEAEDAQILIPMSIWEDFAFDLGEPLTFKVTNAHGTAVRSATVSE